MKVLGNVVIIIIAVVLALCLVRFAMNDYQGDIIPTYSIVQTWFVDFPNLTQELKEVSDWFNTSTGNGFLDFFKNFGAVVVMIGAILSIPFRVIGWFFMHFYTPIVS